MSKDILVTDSLFIFREHEERLEAAGYVVSRLDKPEATEEELCTQVKGKVGYILGGVEKVTERVIDSADELKVISFTGIGYPKFVPAWRYALAKGISVTYAPDAPTQAVAEYAIGAALLMNRGFLEVGRFGESRNPFGSKSFLVTPGVEGQVVGIVGLGRIGRRIAEMSSVFRPARILYYSKHRHDDLAAKLGVSYEPLPDLLGKADIVFLAVSDDAGRGFFGRAEVGSMKSDSLLVSFMHEGIIDEDALYDRLKDGAVRAFSDYPMGERFDALPPSHWFCLNSSNTITHAEAKLSSDIVVDSVLHVLAGEPDPYHIPGLA